MKQSEYPDLDSSDLELIKLLKTKALRSQNYCIAAGLRDVEKILTATISRKWVAKLLDQL